MKENPITTARQFAHDSVAELKKVSHPTRKETIQATIAVFVMIFLFSVFMGLIDLGLSTVFKKILT